MSGQVQRVVSMATLALLCDMADRGVLNYRSEAMSALHSLTDFFYPSSSQHLNRTLLKPTAVTIRSGQALKIYLHYTFLVAVNLRIKIPCITIQKEKFSSK